jgi:hypothetical protein
VPGALCRAGPGWKAMSSDNDIQPFSATVTVALMAVGVLCFVGFVVLFAFAQGPNVQDGGTHAASRSAVGFAGLVELLQATGTPTLASRSLERAAAGGLLVLTPPPGKAPPPNLVNAARGSVLLILPKWRAAPLGSHPGWVQTTGLLSTETVLTTLPGNGARTTLKRRIGTQAPELSAMNGFTKIIASGPIDQLQVLEHGLWKPLLTDQGAGMVLGTDGKGLYVLSDPDLLDNAGLASESGAVAAMSLISGLANGQSVTFDLSLDGLGRSRNPLRAIFEPPLLGATLCAAAACLLAGLLSAVRFGPALPVRRRFELGKTSLTANSAALIARAGREAHMASPYARLCRDLAARAMGIPKRFGPAETNEALDRLQTPETPGINALLAAAASVHNRTGLLTLAQTLYRWRRELRRGHR